MKKQRKIKLFTSIAFLAAFVLWTVLVRLVDRKGIGPYGSVVGFAGLNGWFHSLTGANYFLYDLTDLLSIIPLGLILAFAVWGMAQWFRRKSLWKVDWDILVLGGFYVAVMVAFLLFEVVEINYRPVLIKGVLETSYPSSTTMLAICVMLTAMSILGKRIANKKHNTIMRVAILAFTAFMVIGRAISGVHWITDIIGGALLSAGLVLLFDFFCGLKKNEI